MIRRIGLSLLCLWGDIDEGRDVMGMRWGYGQKVAMAIVYSKLMEIDDQDFVDETFDGIEWVNVLEGNEVTFGRW